MGYALAIVAYQLLSGRHPFDNQPAPAAENKQLRPAPIPGLKRREWRAIRRGLAFERSDRQQHAAEFLRDFEGQSRVRLIAAAAILLVAPPYMYFALRRVYRQGRLWTLVKWAAVGVLYLLLVQPVLGVTIYLVLERM